MITALCVLVVVVRKIYHQFKLADPIGRVWYSKVVAWLISMTEQPLLDVATIRTTFCGTKPVTSRAAANHTHPESAKTRNASVLTIEYICSLLGVHPYFVQMSKSDVRNNRRGMRSYYWGKDVGVKPASFQPARDDVVTLIDTDMYIDMPSLIAAYPRTYMISTFQPTAAAQQNGEFAFTFDEDDTVTYTVSGGAKYVHPVWNYAGDILKTSARSESGLWVQTTFYNVDRRQIGDHHQIVCLTPMRTFSSFLLDMSYLLSGDKLERLKVHDRGFSRLEIKTQEGIKVSTAESGRYACATITRVEDDTLNSMARMGKTELSLAQVKQTINCMDNVASVLVNYHRQLKAYTPDKVYLASESVWNYQFDPVSFDPDAKPSVTPFMSPILDECYAPARSKANDLATINGRLIEVAPKGDLEITEQMMRFMNEFASFVVPEEQTGTGVPVSIDEVFARQTRPSQQNILNAAIQSPVVMSEEPVKSFQKAECYSEIKDPRNISTIPGENKLGYSQYLYAFSDTVMKRMPWYAFGKTPRTVADKVTSICTNAKMAVNTDLSRFDGRVSNILRSLERIIMMRWCNEKYKEECLKRMLSQFNQKGVTKFGVKYETLFSRLSGSPETAAFNSLDNAFMAFCALRRTRINGAFPTPEHAWNSLGVYGGDDGLTADVNPEAYVAACAEVGQKLDIEVIHRGERGITFLSRIYSPPCLVWI